MNYDIPLESDWKLFRKKVPNWQEAYMDKLIKKYTEMLNGEKLSSDKFWLLDKWIKKDQKSAGVIIDMRRSMMYRNILLLLKDHVITLEDLDDFSEAVKEYVAFFL